MIYRLAALWLGLAMLVAWSDAAGACLSRHEARAKWPRAHLYWSVENGRRCWSNGRGKTRNAVQAVTPAIRYVPLPYVEPRLVPKSPDKFPVPETPDFIEGWDWFDAARQAERSTVVYSTFVGEPPDIWPVLNRQPFNWAAVLCWTFILCVVFVGVLGLTSAARKMNA